MTAMKVVAQRCEFQGKPFVAFWGLEFPNVVFLADPQAFAESTRNREFRWEEGSIYAVIQNGLIWREKRLVGKASDLVLLEEVPEGMYTGEPDLWAERKN